MATSVNDRVKRYRERQRQAHPQEPLWHTLIGRLHVADLWLSQGGAVPDSFADAIRAVAAKIGLRVADEPPAATREPPRSATAPKPAPKPPKAKPQPTAEERAAKREREQAEWAEAYKATTERMTLYEDQVMPRQCAVVDRVWTENVKMVGLFKAPPGTRLETISLILERATKNGKRYEKLWFKRYTHDADIVEECSRRTWTAHRAVKTSSGDTVKLDATDTAKYAAVLGLDMAVWDRSPNKTAREKYLKRRYRRLAMRHHPDKGGDKQTFMTVQAAYEYFEPLTHLKYFV